MTQKQTYSFNLLLTLVRGHGVTTGPQSITRLTDWARYLLVGPLPEDSQGEDGGDGWGEVAGHRLDVDVKLATVGRLQDGDPHHAHHHQDHGHDPGSEHSPQGRLMAADAAPAPPRGLPADQEQLLLRGSWAVLLPDVDGEERGAAVEDGGQRRHQGGHHDCDHESPQPCGRADGDKRRHPLATVATVLFSFKDL